MSLSCRKLVSEPIHIRYSFACISSGCREILQKQLEESKHLFRALISLISNSEGRRNCKMHIVTTDCIMHSMQCMGNSRLNYTIVSQFISCYMAGDSIRTQHKRETYVRPNQSLFSSFRAGSFGSQTGNLSVNST